MNPFEHQSSNLPDNDAMASIEPIRRKDIVGAADFDGNGLTEPNEQQRAGETFAQVDTNYDGAVSREEFLALYGESNTQVGAAIGVTESDGGRPNAPLARAFNEAVICAAAHHVLHPDHNYDTITRVTNFFDSSKWTTKEFDLLAARVKKMDSGTASVFLGSQQLNEHTVTELARRGVSPYAYYYGHLNVEAARLFIHFHGTNAPKKDVSQLLNDCPELKEDISLIARCATAPVLLDLFAEDAVRKVPSAFATLQAFRDCAPKVESRYINELEREELTLNRYSLRTETPGAPRGRKTAVVLFPTSDHNGAFNSTPIAPLIGAGFFVLFYEMESDRDIERALKEASHGGKNPADLVIIGAHGMPTGMQVSPGVFGFGLTDRSKFDAGDIFRLKLAGVDRFVVPGANIILQSCSTGFGGHLPLPLNLATSVWKSFGCKADVWAPSHSSYSNYHNQIAFDADGKLIHPGLGFNGHKGKIVHIKAKE